MSDGESISKSDLNSAVSDLKLYFSNCTKEERESLEKMCQENIKQGITNHLLDKKHFDKSTIDNIYEIINNFKVRIQIKYAIGIPLLLLFAERLFFYFGSHITK